MKRNPRLPHIKLQTRAGKRKYVVIKPTTWGKQAAELTVKAKAFAAAKNWERENETTN